MLRIFTPKRAEMKKVDSSVLAMDCHAVQAPLAMTENAQKWILGKTQKQKMCFLNNSQDSRIER